MVVVYKVNKFVSATSLKSLPSSNSPNDERKNDCHCDIEPENIVSQIRTILTLHALLESITTRKDRIESDATHSILGPAYESLESSYLIHFSTSSFLILKESMLNSCCTNPRICTISREWIQTSDDKRLEIQFLRSNRILIQQDRCQTLSRTSEDKWRVGKRLTKRSVQSTQIVFRPETRVGRDVRRYPWRRIRREGWTPDEEGESKKPCNEKQRYYQCSPMDEGRKQSIEKSFDSRKKRFDARSSDGRIGTIDVSKDFGEPRIPR